MSLRSGLRCDKISLVLGGVAQGLEQAAHNRLVAGSNPAAPTTKREWPKAIFCCKTKGCGSNQRFVEGWQAIKVARLFRAPAYHDGIKKLTPEGQNLIY